MRDILVRLAHSHPTCTCGAWFGEPHGELCILQVVRDAEAEILRLRMLDRDIPNMMGHTLHD